MRVRLDDRSTTPPTAWEFHGLLDEQRAEALGDVVGCLAAAEAAARSGRWVVIAVAYEAAPAFDPAMRSAPRPPAGTPFVWWAAFAERRAGASLDVVASRVTARHRAPNVMAYPDAVRDVRRRIAEGDVYQVNVTDRYHGRYTGTPFEMYSALVSVQSCQFAAFIDAGDRVVASASPELFVRWDGDTITCRPMKGTAARHPRPQRDVEVGDELRASVKDRAENVMIVDLLRNDLSRLARLGTVRVPELFALERYETVWQLTSTITAQARDDVDLVDVFRATFPCGSVTGAPKIAAMSIIAQLEREPRGLYCGAIGCLAPPGAGPRAVFSVPIRTAVLDPVASTFVYGAGGGITWSSDPAAEDDEVRAKARILTRSQRPFRLLETMRHDASGVGNLADHLDRMEAAARWFGFPVDRDRAAAAVAAIPPVDAPHRLRLLAGRDGDVHVEQHPLDDVPSPVRLAVDDQATASDDPFCCHKTTWRRQYDDARRRFPAADDVVLVNEHGAAIETTIANLAYRIGQDWFTPPLADGGLAGIARGRAIAAGRLAERSIAARDLATVDQVAVVNDLRGWRDAVLIG